MGLLHMLSSSKALPWSQTLRSHRHRNLYPITRRMSELPKPGKRLPDEVYHSPSSARISSFVRPRTRCINVARRARDLPSGAKAPDSMRLLTARPEAVPFQNSIYATSSSPTVKDSFIPFASAHSFLLLRVGVTLEMKHRFSSSTSSPVICISSLYSRHFNDTLRYGSPSSLSPFAAYPTSCRF